MVEFIALLLSVLSGVIVSLVTLWLAGRQRVRQERRTETRRREAILVGIGRELQWNRTATRGDAGREQCPLHDRIAGNRRLRATRLGAGDDRAAIVSGLYSGITRRSAQRERASEALQHRRVAKLTKSYADNGSICRIRLARE